MSKPVQLQWGDSVLHKAQHALFIEEAIHPKYCLIIPKDQHETILVKRDDVVFFSRP